MFTIKEVLKIIEKTILQIPDKVGGLQISGIQDASLKALKRTNIHTIIHVFMYHSNRVLIVQQMNSTSPPYSGVPHLDARHLQVSYASAL